MERFRFYNAPMTSPIYTSHRQIPVSFLLNSPQASLDQIRSALGNINEIRRLVENDVNLYLCLFRQAVEENDAVSQIQLAFARFAEKSSRNFELLFLMYREAMNESIDRQRVIDTYSLAASQGYIPAFLELKHAEWEPYSLTCFGFACQLRPYVGMGDQQLDCLFGRALRGCGLDTDLYQASIFFMDPANSSADKLHYVNMINPDWFQIHYDPTVIKALLEEYKIDTIYWDNHPHTVLKLYAHGKEIGQVSYNLQNRHIEETISYPSIAPVIEFIENVMTRSGSAKSAMFWLAQLRGS